MEKYKRLGNVARQVDIPKGKTGQVRGRQCQFGECPKSNIL